MLKRLVLVCPLAACLLSGAMAASQTQPVNPQEEADHQSLRALKAVYEQAVRENQISRLGPYLHQDFHGVMVTGRAVNSLADLEQYWRDVKALIGERGTYTSTLNPERSIIVGDFALARGTTDDVVKTDDGTEFRFNTMWTATLQRDATSWKLRSVQGTMDPVGNPFVREFARRALVRTASISLLAGLLVGLAFGLIWQKRRARRVAM
jgi:ketosteroid isomerase-like protein